MGCDAHKIRISSAQSNSHFLSPVIADEFVLNIITFKDLNITVGTQFSSVRNSDVG
jgi:hypothetical protein